jgi:type IV pilus assembly protein PilO
MKLSLTLPQHVYDTVYGIPTWQKAAIFVVSLIIPVALFWFLFFSATWTEIESIEQKIPHLEQEIARLKSKEKIIPKLEQELEDMKNILAKAMELLPEKEDIPSILTEISSLANRERLTIQSFAPKEEKKTGFYAAIPFEIKFSGPFHNSVRFFAHIINMPRIVQIKSVKMGNPEKQRSVQSKQAGGNRGGGEGSVSSGWVITTDCIGETYRFLTPEEQAELRKKRAGKKKKGR